MLYQVRRANLNDTSKIQKFYKDSLSYISVQQTRWISGVYPSIETASSVVSDEEFFICLDEQNTVVGSMILNNKSDDEYHKLKWFESPEDAENLIVHTLISHTQRLKQGIASQMISFIKKFAAENNMFSIRLETSVDKVLARKQYEKNGFAYIGRHNLTNFDGSGLNDCVFYEYKVQA